MSEENLALKPIELGYYHVTVEQARELSKAMVAAKIFDTDNPDQALVKIIAGQELRVGPVASVNFMFIVNKKISTETPLQAALLRRAGYRWTPRWDNVDNPTSCEITFWHETNPNSKYVSRFTIEDARRAKLLVKDNWQKYPKNMLYARAFSNGARVFAPEALMGFGYTREELESIPNNDIPTIEGEVSMVDDTNPSAEPLPASSGEATGVSEKPFEEMYPFLFKKFGDLKNKCWVHDKHWYIKDGQYGEMRSHQENGGFCNFNELFKKEMVPIYTVIFSRSGDEELDNIALAKELTKRRNEAVKKIYPDKTWSKLNLDQQLELIEKWAVEAGL